MVIGTHTFQCMTQSEHKSFKLLVKLTEWIDQPNIPKQGIIENISVASNLN